MSIHIQVENSKCGLQECLWNVDGVLPKNSHEQLGMYSQINQSQNLIKAQFTHNKMHTFWVHSFDEFGQMSSLVEPPPKHITVRSASQSLSCVRFSCNPMDCSPPGSSVRGNFPDKNTWVDYHFLLQEIFLTQGLKLCLLHWQAGSLPLSQLGSPSYRHTLFYYVLPYCALTILHFFFFFYKLKICGNTTNPRSVGAIFKQHLLTSCFCHILVILTICQTFSLLLYLLGWSLISDLWCYYSDLLKAQRTVSFSNK